MTEGTLAHRLEVLLQPTVEAMSFSIVRILLSGQKRPRLQIMVERRDGAPMLVDDCAEVSRAVSAVLDVEDPISGAYTLEISSPGLDRPLVRLTDFDRFAGLDARVEMNHPIEGRRRFTGQVLGTAGEQVRLRMDGAEVRLPHADIQRAKLLLTDELLAASEGQRREEERAKR